MDAILAENSIKEDAITDNISLNNVVMTSGIGQLHTNDYDPLKTNKKLDPYIGITFNRIRLLVDKPQCVDKEKAQWLIPSTHPSRNFKEQEQHGDYWMLWADLDKNPPALLLLADIVEELVGGCDFEIYSSRSASIENQKARALIFLDMS
jgi:hypothetical protein